MKETPAKPCITLTKTNRSNRLNLIETDDKLAAQIGRDLAKAFELSHLAARDKNSKELYQTAWGNKTHAELARMAIRVLTRSHGVTIQTRTASDKLVPIPNEIDIHPI